MADCGTCRFLIALIAASMSFYTQAVSEKSVEVVKQAQDYETVHESDNWQLDAIRPSRSVTNQNKNAYTADMRSCAEKSAQGEHALSGFGYHSATLVGEGDNFSLYTAKKRSGNASLPMVMGSTNRREILCYRGMIPSSAMLMGYLAENSRRCKAHIKNPEKFRLNQIITTTDGYGNSSSSSSPIYDIVIPGRFAPVLEQKFSNDDGTIGMSDVVSAAAGGQSLAAGMKEPQQAFEWVERTQADVERIVANGGCNDPERQQFEEMLYYDVAGKNPAEYSTLSFTDAVEYSDPLYQPGTASSLKSACVINVEFGTGMTLPSYKAIKWCECVAAQILKVRPGSVDEYTKRYKQYQRDRRIARTKIDREQDDRKDRRLYAIQQHCVSR